MAIQSVSPVSFKGNSNVQSNQRPKGGAGKAAVSYFIPGLGEFLDGRNKEGAFFLGSRLGVGVLGGLASRNIVKSATDNVSEFVGNAMKQLDNDVESFDYGNLIKGTINSYVDAFKANKVSSALYFTAFAAGMGLAIANIVDAYKGGKDNKVDVEA